MSWGRQDFTVVFGLDNKKPEHIELALQTGYRIFDAADTYGETTVQLGAAMRKLNIPREDVTVVYKVDITAPDALAGRLEDLTAAFPAPTTNDGKGYIDEVLIHHFDSKAKTLQVRDTILSLKAKGLIHGVGYGDVTSKDIALCKEPSSIELKMYDMVVDMQNFIEICGSDHFPDEAPVYAYYVIDAVQRIMQNNEPHSIHGLLQLVQGYCSNHKILPILSSKTEARIKSNFDAGKDKSGGDDSMLTMAIQMAKMERAKTFPAWDRKMPGQMRHFLRKAVVEGHQYIDFNGDANGGQTVKKEVDERLQVLHLLKEKEGQAIQEAAKRHYKASVTKEAGDVQYKFKCCVEPKSYANLVEGIFSPENCNREGVDKYLFEVYQVYWESTEGQGK
eukprot:g3704.t1